MFQFDLKPRRLILWSLLVSIFGFLGCGKPSSTTAPTVSAAPPILDSWRLKAPVLQEDDSPAPTLFKNAQTTLHTPGARVIFPSLKATQGKGIQFQVKAQCGEHQDEFLFQDRAELQLSEILPASVWFDFIKIREILHCTYYFKAQNPLGSIHEFQLSNIAIAYLDQSLGQPLLKVDLKAHSYYAWGALAPLPLNPHIQYIDIICEDGLSSYQNTHLQQALSQLLENYKRQPSTVKMKSERLCRLQATPKGALALSAVFKLQLGPLALSLQFMTLPLKHVLKTLPSHQGFQVDAFYLTAQNPFAHPVQIQMAPTTTSALSGQFLIARKLDPPYIAQQFEHFSTGRLLWSLLPKSTLLQNHNLLLTLQPGATIRLKAQLQKNCRSINESNGIAVQIARDVKWTLQAGSQTSAQSLWPQGWLGRHFWIPIYKANDFEPVMSKAPTAEQIFKTHSTYCG